MTIPTTGKSLQLSQMIDPFGREIDYLRLSVTDRCNLRCLYCMPPNGLPLIKKGDVLSWEEMTRLCAIFVRIGVGKIRITGGEPFVRKGFMGFLTELKRLPDTPEFAITTNGTLLEDYLLQLNQLGIKRLNISLDSLDTHKFHTITGRNELNTVRNSLDVAYSMGFTLKINMVVLPGINDSEIPEFVELTRDRNWTIRFIEPMPFDTIGGRFSDFITGDTILKKIKNRYSLDLCKNSTASVDKQFRVKGYSGKIGIIYGYSRKFCHDCSRIRLSVKGGIRTCLYGKAVLNLRTMLRIGESDDAIIDAIRTVVAKRHINGFDAAKRHDISVFDSMSAIGG